MPKLELLFVSHKYPPATGGMEKQSYELIQGMHPYAKVHQLVYRKGNESIFMFFYRLNSRIIDMLAQNPSIQCIHFNDGLIASFALFHKGYQHIKQSVTLHGLDVVFPVSYFQQKIIPRFNRYDLIIAVSEATAVAARFRGIDAHRIQVINNGVDHQLASPKTESLTELQQRYPSCPLQKPYLITLGRPVKRKGFSWLLKEVIPHMPQNFHLIMLGPFHAKPTISERLLQLLPRKWHQILTLFLGYPTDQSAIRKLLKTKELQNKVTHLGKVPFQDLQLFLQHATAFLMPNLSIPGDMEGFGLVCLEASISGTLVLASNMEGITDAIHHQKNGLLLPSADVAAWIKQLKALQSDPKRYQQQAKAFQSYSITQYSWEKMCADYAAAFKKLNRNTPIKTI
ncbi:glycosyltransferase family 4 protein [Sphingobacterium sp. HJSM2_6]|uniref:glycosyltransferase family 4 protein n=1 Tax=Sphingobacterium sp. HJSM2_6 TaxID=3366264 RepID=UPI003BDB85E2